MSKCVSFLAAVATVVSVAGFGYPARAGTPAPICAWQYSSSTMNADWPDSNAEYWVTPFTLQADLKIIVHGAYPAARYFSITAYNSLGTASTANVIHDTQIAPSADGSYTVTISHDVPGANSISFANAFNGTAGYLDFRVYVPTSTVPLPSLTFTSSSGSAALQPCSAYAPPNFTGLDNNPENSYVAMYPPYPMGNTVTVISGKAPTLVRYWSLCSYLWTSAVVDCRYDGDIPLIDGYYHLVLGKLAQKSTVAAAGYTYLQYGGMVMLRNLLGNQTTGDYAPVVKTCVITDRSCIGG